MNCLTHSPTRRLPSLALALALGTLSACSTLDSSAPISDQQVDTSHRAYERQQGQIKALNDSGEHRVASYSLAKSQCWLDTSYHEFSRKDRSDFVPEALQQSQMITHYLASGAAPDNNRNPAHQTPLINGAEKLRPDLWDMAANLKQQPGFSCAAQQLACAEVELVHAGNEFNQQGWRHAKPYVQIAEDLMGEAFAANQHCDVPAKPLSLLVNVLFNFDKHSMDQTYTPSMDKLASVVAQLNSGQYTLLGLSLTGHADRSNGTGDPNYNLLLSQRRAKAVLEYLHDHNIDVDSTPIEHRGDTQQLDSCESQSYTRDDLIDCLLPNRRVEVLLELLPR